MLSLSQFFEDEISLLKSKKLYRSLKTIDSTNGIEFFIDSKKYISFSSNNYLGLSNHPLVKSESIKALEKYGIGTGASRLISGNFRIHELLEEKIASFKKKPASIVFSTGYMANIGTISSIVDNEDVVIIDRFNHASIIDGCRLSSAKLFVYKHNDMNSLSDILKRCSKFKKKLIVTDTVFSMDGDVAPLKKIVKLSLKYDCILMIDEAHALGVFGKNGRGVAEFLNVEDKIDISMGTLSKAVGCLGAYIAGNLNLIDYLRNKARSFIYTTSLPSGIIAGCLASLDIIIKEPELRKRLWGNVKYVRDGIKNLGLNTLNSTSQIIPIIIGDEEKTIKISKTLFDRGLFIVAIRPPTIPKGTSRLRISISSAHTKEHLDKLLETLKCIKEYL